MSAKGDAPAYDTPRLLGRHARKRLRQQSVAYRSDRLTGDLAQTPSCGATDSGDSLTAQAECSSQMGTGNDVEGPPRFIMHCKRRSFDILDPVVVMSLHTSLVLRPTQSRPRVRRPPQARLRAPDVVSAVGSANSSRTQFGNWFWTISGCATRSAGRCSTGDSAIVLADRSFAEGEDAYGLDDLRTLPARVISRTRSARKRGASRSSSCAYRHFRSPTQRCAAKCVATKRGYPRVIVASCQRADPGGHRRAPGSGRKHLFSVSCGCA